MSYVVERLGPSVPPAELAEVLRQVADRFPGSRLTRNPLGNLNVMMPVEDGWQWQGFVDVTEPGWEREPE